MRKLVVLILSASLGACASIVKSSTQTVQLTGGLDDGSTKVTTPIGNHQLVGGSTTVMLPKSKADIPIEITCNNQTQKTVLPTRFDVLLGGLGNVVFGGIIGWIVDGASDKAYDAPAQFNVGPFCSSPETRSTASKN